VPEAAPGADAIGYVVDVQPFPGAPVPPSAGTPAASGGGSYPYGAPPGPPPAGSYPSGAYPAGPYPTGSYPAASYPVGPYSYGPYPPYPPPRPRIGLPRPSAIAAVPGTPFGVAVVEIRPTVSGPAVASLVAGIGAILVSTVVILFAALGAADGWGTAVAGAFAVLGTVVGVAAAGLGGAGLRRIRTSAAWGPTKGRGVAVTGLVCGVAGLVITVLTMLVSLAS
jgi:hypothetical protein